MTPLQPVDGPIPAAVGIGLRFAHHREVVETRPPIAWFEVHAENYLGGGPTPAALSRVRQHYPIALHAVGLSLGSAQGLAQDHLDRIAGLIDRFEPGLVSEHLTWSVVDGAYLADLLPLPMTEEALDVVCRNVERAQQAFRRRLLLENPSSYLCYRHSTIPEWEFLAAVTRRTGCGILCDVNNVFVSAANHGWSASEYLAGLPPHAVGQIHLAGHSVRELDSGGQIHIDDHGSRVSEPVWALFGEAVERFGRVPTLIEWDTNIPPLDVLMAEARTAQQVLDRRRNGSRHAIAA